MRKTTKEQGMTEQTTYEYGMYGRLWGTVEAGSDTEARKLIRKKWNVRSTKGMTVRPLGTRDGVVLK